MFRKIFHWIVFGNFYIALVATMMLLEGYRILTIPFKVSQLAFVFFATLGIYALHWRYTYLYNNKIQRLVWTEKHRPVLVIISLISLVTAFIIGFGFLIKHFVFFIVVFGLVLAYTGPKIPFMRSFKLQNGIVFGKTLHLALVWMIVTWGFPLLGQLHLPIKYIAFGVHKFFFLYAICLLFDIRDANTQENIRSEVKGWGTQKAYLVALISNFIAMLLLVWLSLHFSVKELFFLLVPCLSLLLLYRKAKKSQSDVLFYFGLDGLMMASSVLSEVFK